MLFRSFVILIAFASTSLVVSGSEASGIAVVEPVADRSTQLKRSLRLGIFESGDEDRGALTDLGKMDDVLSKTEKASRKAVTVTSKWKTLVLRNIDELVEHSRLTQKLSGLKLYKDVGLEKMSLSTLRQLDDMEVMRLSDIKNGIKGTKTTPDGMRRKMENVPAGDIAPEKFLKSHIGRSEQRFDTDGSRLLSSGVVSRPAEQGGGEVLLISSSNPEKGDFLLPKGGWDKGEGIEMAALREMIEEGGVNAKLLHKLGDYKVKEQTKHGEQTYTYKAFKMEASKVYVDYAESIRYRVWVPFEDAMLLLANRPYMVQLVKKAKEIDDLVKLKKLPAVDPHLGSFKLDLN
ncbi:Nudix hydrolase 21 [Phytophthora citrophthora]|uniref:Nudix hydrolase 21 n=1 Tax=Phytophthora citrophthora TaxID=4793 RepID=A0AAD9GRH4_9STRA|nr:Nudix hydrolase 21 [Phytophthora citrophthora]